MLWVGWFGFNAGSALAANGQAGMAIVVTQISAATAALVRMGCGVEPARPDQGVAAELLA
jgi:ammonia channel protein AmtB